MGTLHFPELSPNEGKGARTGPGGWAVTIALSIFFSAVGAFWLKWATFPQLTSQLCEAIPPIPAIATLIFLVGLRAFLGLFARSLRMSRQQIITVYAFVGISVPLGFVNFYRRILTDLTVPNYGTLAEALELKEYVPSWMVPTDEVVVRGFWEGSPNQAVPWNEWFIPMLSIGATLLLFYIAVICMLRLFYTRWSREERLSYPVVQLALNMVEEQGGRRGAGAAMLRSRVFWIGVASALIFNLFYIIPALHPTWKLPPYQLYVSDYLVDPPWNAAGKWYIRFNPMVFGLGFLVSTDVLLSIWVGFLLLKFETIFLASMGVPATDVFLIGEKQGLGASVAIVLFMVWAARRQILGALRRVLPGAQSADRAEAGRWTVLLLAGSLAGLLLVMVHVGMAGWLAVVFLGALMVRSLVMARVRAQTGIPQIYLDLGTVRSIVWLTGGALLASTGMGSVAGLIFMSFLATAAVLAPHHADALNLAERSGLSLRRWAVIAVFAVIVGLVLVNLTHLPAFYKEGSANIAEMTVEKATWGARQILDTVHRSAPPEKLKLGFALTGFLTTCILTYLRRFYWFPFHPVGFVAACGRGYLIFGPILLIWFIKWTILRYFGGEVFRKAKDYFMGLVMGHFFVASIWGILAAFRWAPTQRYQLGFW